MILVKLKSLNLYYTYVIYEIDAPPLPRTSMDFNEVPNAYRFNKKGELFILYDSGPATQRLLIFGTPISLNWLRQADILGFDRTFKTSPTIFGQIFSIHVFMKSRCVVAVVALITGQHEHGYAHCFRQLKYMCPEINPSLFICDFERAFLNACKLEFLHLNRHGCFFHFQDAICRKVNF